MRKILLIMFMVVFWGSVVYASDVSLTIKEGMYFPTDSQFQQGNHLQLNLNWKNIYAFGSYTTTERRIAGQRAGTFNILGFGLGLDIPITKNLSIWGQAGYYLPNSELVGTTAGHKYDEWAHFQEPQYLYWQKWGIDHNYNVTGYRVYQYKIATGSLGGAVGINLLQSINNHLDIGIAMGYQLLRFQETFYARNPSSPNVNYIQTRQDANLSGMILGVTLIYRF